MNIKEELKSHFHYIKNVFFENEFNKLFLRIEIDFRNLEKITNASKEIISFLDKKNLIHEEYFLDIYSPGTDEEFNLKQSHNFIGKSIKVKLNKSLKNKNEFIGELILFQNNELTIKWNSKGQFRKQIINIDNISKIQKYAKIK